jgi:hypothetical protein
MKKLSKIRNCWIVILLCFISQKHFSQDTLILLDGQTKIGKVLGIDRNLNILEFKSNEEKFFISLSQLKKYSFNLSDEKWNNSSLFTYARNESNQVLRFGSNRKLLSFSPSKYSFGVNFSTLFDPALVNDFDNFGRTYSTNSHFECFFQLDLNDKFALRFPMRIGIKPLKETVINPTNDFFGAFSRELIGDIGIEPIFYFNSNRVKLKWFTAPSFSIVAGKPVKRILDDIDNPLTYIPMNQTFCYRIGALIGYQYWFGPRLQFETTIGFFVTNNYWDPNDFIQESYFGRNFRLALIYRI